MKILITGGAGFLGTSLVEQLLLKADKLGIEKITIFDSLLFKEDGFIPILRDPRVELVIGDVRDRQLLESLVWDADVIYPLAALVGAPRCAKTPKEAFAINHSHVLNIIDTCELLGDTGQIQHGQRKIIYPNTNSIYGQSKTIVTEDSDTKCLSVYAESKYAAEQNVLKYGGISLRLATLAGLSFRQRKDLLVNSMTLAALNPGYVLMYEPHFQRNYISVRDAARAFVHALENYDLMDGYAFNCGNTKLNCSKLELSEHIKKYLPKFIVSINEFEKDPDQRSYEVSNERIESTGFKCEDDFDVIIPQVIKGYKAMLECNTRYTNL